MATEIVRPRARVAPSPASTALPPGPDDEMLSPLSATGREIGSEAVAEINELVGLILNQSEMPSGFAMRGLLNRIGDLACTAQRLLDGTDEDPYELAASVAGGCTKQAVAWAQALRSEAGAG